MKKSKAAIVAMAIATSACSMDTSGLDISAGPLLGAAIGGAAGGYLGAQFGGGLGQSLYTAAGALSGLSVGYAAGRSLMPGDRLAYNGAVTSALGDAPRGEYAAWNNSESGNSGIIRPGRTFAGVNGQLCRTYRATVAFNDDIVGGDGAACLDSRGDWVLVADAFG